MKYIIINILIILAFALNVIAQETVSVPIVSEESIQKDVEKVDCDNDRRLDSVKNYLLKKVRSRRILK